MDILEDVLRIVAEGPKKAAERLKELDKIKKAEDRALEKRHLKEKRELRERLRSPIKGIKEVFDNSKKYSKEIAESLDNLAEEYYSWWIANTGQTTGYYKGSDSGADKWESRDKDGRISYFCDNMALDVPQQLYNECSIRWTYGEILEDVFFDMCRAKVANHIHREEHRRIQQANLASNLAMGK